MNIATRSVCAALASGLVACVMPATAPDQEPAQAAAAGTGETALYRIGEGESLSVIAERLSFPGGWRALAGANGLRGDRIRAGAALQIPVDYLREAGLDPYVDFGLEAFPQPRAREALVPCHVERDEGACATVGDARLCVEATAPAIAASMIDADDAFDRTCDDANDGTMECGMEAGRELVRYRGGERDVIARLPNRGELDVEALRVDLDGDGRTELVAAVPIEVHNHEGWSAVRAMVLDDRGALAASFDVEQWGEGSLVEAPPGERGCDLLATRWEWVRHPLEGEGMYFVGHRLAWVDGALAPRAGEVLRRFRTYFHVTCAECDGLGPQTPAAWLSSREASWWPELGDGTPVRSAERGTIVGAGPARFGGVAFEVALEGRRVRIDPDAVEFDDERPPDVLTLAWVRLGASGGTLPEVFVPAAIDRWIGRPVIVEERGEDDVDDDGGGARRRALWIDPPHRFGATGDAAAAPDMSAGSR